MLPRIRAGVLIGVTVLTTPLTAQGPASDFKPDTVVRRQRPGRVDGRRRRRLDSGEG